VDRDQQENADLHAKHSMDKEKLPWRSFADAKGAFADKWKPPGTCVPERKCTIPAFPFSVPSACRGFQAWSNSSSLKFLPQAVG
jgi:hypothetical protein